MRVPLPPPDLAERFSADVTALVGEPKSLGLAVSGGPDSLAMLLLGAAAFPGRVLCLTVDHGLRAESSREAEFVARICEALAVPHRILTVAVPRGGAGLQGEARRARYAAFRSFAKAEQVPILCTAHHVDDQAETILMRLARGSGLGGLAGVRAVRWDGDALRIARPLLGWRRSELADIVAAAGIAPVEDPSNDDIRFDRVAMRRFLAQQDVLDPGRLARSAASLRDAEEALQWIVSRMRDERVSEEGGTLSFASAGLPPEIIRRILLLILTREGKPPPRGEELTRLAASLAAGGTVTLAGTKCAGGPVWTFSAEPPRRA